MIHSELRVIFYSIHLLALIVKIQANTHKSNTVKHKVFTIQT